VALCSIPLYIILRREWGAIGLAIASAIAILIYVGLLGWLQRRRFSREAAIRGDRLDRVGGFLRASLRPSQPASPSQGDWEYVFCFRARSKTWIFLSSSCEA